MNIIHLAHVADAITELTGNDDYDEVADEAARLLDWVGSLDAEAARYNSGEIEWEHFTVIVQAALNVPPEPTTHADNSAGLPACGWIHDGEQVTSDMEAVTCRFCSDTINAGRIIASLSARFPNPPF